MSKNLKINVFCSIAILLIVSYFFGIGLQNNAKEIEKAVLSLNQPMTKIVHIEALENNKAIAFYEWGTAPEDYFGIINLKKDLFGWHLMNGSTSATPKEYKIGWSFSDLKRDFSNYTDILYGKIFDAEIVDVLVNTDNGKQYSAKIIDDNNGEKFWFLITDGVKLTGSTITARSQDGKIIEQITR
ncbi:hypothetical protein BVG16_29195 [Paenibacillus selenitireducens]|uniref:Uncharacterized protein n=1 Tax=Paenibacillus selenitireducens TaxID=1324314 RepID=A0A1T2X091_9BACL|nr:hypothetical protein [Paenibacillus selenitireducens]OPA73287.1 hypothetical protein BVG16_29195 [Paenibacillus selenitireducens]